VLLFLSHIETLTSTYPADRFTCLIEEICRVLSKHGRERFIAQPLLLLIWNRIMGMARRFASLAERVRTGRLSHTAPARSRNASPPPAGAAEQPRVAPAEVLPRHFRWLVNMLPEAETFGADLCWLLQRLETEELIFAAPQVGRILRPLCRMLGVEPTAALRLPVRVPVRSATVASGTEAASAQHADDGPADDGTSPQWGGPQWGGPQAGGPSLLSDTEAQVWELGSRKRA
jgi:hypothetical protein